MKARNFMQPKDASSIPVGENWLYEIKYDGYRVLLKNLGGEVSLISRGGNSLNDKFPEIVHFCQDHIISDVVLDGEIAILSSATSANYEKIQIRGKLQDKLRIKEMVQRYPAYFLAFDILEMSGQDFRSLPYLERKNILRNWITDNNLPRKVCITKEKIQLIEATKDSRELWEKVTESGGEGIVAKRIDSLWTPGKSDVWLKIKNRRRNLFIITGFNRDNGYFSVGVFRGMELCHIGSFTHGIDDISRNALLGIIESNKKGAIAKLAIVVELEFLDVTFGQLREPRFVRFVFDADLGDITYDKLVNKIEIKLTNPDKKLFQDKEINKKDFVNYLMQIAPYMLPFLENRELTVVRYPHGAFGDSFFQKNCPEYAPDFVKTYLHKDINYIVCNTTRTLAWLGNQLAFEYHIPFNHIGQENSPSEIVFDLDPSEGDFQTAIYVANLTKDLLDSLNITSFIKTSGGKGLQVYIPLPTDVFTYEDTNLFNKFVAESMVAKDPNWITTKRMKKERGKKLYFDYLQHGKGKTIIAPYSVRVTSLVATPIFWYEVNDQLSPSNFSMEAVTTRIKQNIDPFRNYWDTDNGQLNEIIDYLKSN